MSSLNIPLLGEPPTPSISTVTIFTSSGSTVATQTNHINESQISDSLPTNASVVTQIPESSLTPLGGTLQSHGISRGRIIAAVLGSVVGVAIIVAVIFLLRRRHRDTVPRPLLPEEQIPTRSRTTLGTGQTVAREGYLESRTVGVESRTTSVPVEDGKTESRGTNDINVQQLFQDREFESQLLQFIQRRMDRIPLRLNSSSLLDGIASTCI
jgi:hypothetical protein